MKQCPGVPAGEYRAGLTAACTVALHWRLLLQGHHGDNWGAAVGHDRCQCEPHRSDAGMLHSQANTLFIEIRRGSILRKWTFWSATSPKVR